MCIRDSIKGLRTGVFKLSVFHTLVTERVRTDMTYTDGRSAVCSVGEWHIYQQDYLKVMDEFS